MRRKIYFKIINGSLPLIIKKVSKQKLIKLLKQDISKKYISACHWFGNSKLWYELNYGYNNPYNIGLMHPEYLLIEKQGKLLTKYLRKKTIVFFGLGVGDTESAIVKNLMNEQNHTQLIGIDVNINFIRNFIQSLGNLLKEYSQLSLGFLGVNGLFEELRKKDLEIINSNYSSKALICLGNTIGNNRYENELPKIFKNLSNPGDILIVGYQLNTHIKEAYQKYKSNKLWKDFIARILNNIDKDLLQWDFDQKKSIIQAFYKDINIFRSKKFTLLQMNLLLKKVKFKEVNYFLDTTKNTCIHIFERIN